MAMTPNVIAGDSPGNFIGTPGGENLYSPPSAGLQPGGSSMTPAPWQLPSGGATTPQAAFQNDFATAQDFRDKAIASGADPAEADATYFAPLRTKWKAIASGADPAEADATYFAPLRTKWKTIAAAPKVFLDNNNFLKFNSEFAKATDNFNSEIQSGSSPKVAAQISLMPVLEKWTLNPTLKTQKPDVPKLVKEALDLAGKADSKITDIPNLALIPPAERNSIISYYEKIHPKPKLARTASQITAEAKQWNEIANDPGMSSERRAIAVQKLGDLQDELFKENPLRVTPSEAPLDQSQMYHPTPGVYPEGMTLPLPKPETTLQLPGKSKIPNAGDVLKGYRFLGGNPADKSNWEKVNE